MVLSKRSLTDTELWGNLNSTSDFAGQTIPLSSGVSNFDFIEVRYRKTTTVSTECSIMFKSSDYTNIVPGKSAGLFQLYFGQHSYDTPTGRRLSYASDTTLTISHCYRIGFNVSSISSGTQTVNNHVIPLKVYGWK